MYDLIQLSQKRCAREELYKKSFQRSPLSWYSQRGVLGDKCWPKKDDGVIGDKSLGWSLTVVRGLSLTMRTASATNVCNSIKEGKRRVFPMVLLSAPLNNLTIISQLPPWLGA